jgi:poly(beta-D-mannuronate) lyase
MTRLLSVLTGLLMSVAVNAGTIIVKTPAELKTAADKAQPGDVIILKNGDWKDTRITLKCEGTEKQPITFKAETAGKVRLTGNSWLKIGGTYIIVDGWLFENGFAGSNPVIDFRANKNTVANNCRVTNTVINDFNNPRRMDENYWISFSGKNNRLDHCSFRDKKNMGVLLAVILDDDRSRENNHSIDHNHFGRRPPLGSNSGEIIRVGVSQHCQFNSNTQITDNYFEYCDGETEIVSIKSGGNVVRGNVFKESQGSVVLRHGDNNTVTDNLFLGNGKPGTGGVRVINKGQWVVNNYFYQCRGVDFRSPLSVMNGIPNSPAHRYVQVTDAVIANNTFIDCTPASFCEGSDAERTLPPDNVWLVNNIFYNNTDSLIYRAFDATNGFNFAGNTVNKNVKQEVDNGFAKTPFNGKSYALYSLPLPAMNQMATLSDSLQQVANQRLGHPLSEQVGFRDGGLIQQLRKNIATCGAPWIKINATDKQPAAVTVNCRTADEVYKALEKNRPVIIKLTGRQYDLTRPFVIGSYARFTAGANQFVNITTPAGQRSAFEIAGKGHLVLQQIRLDGAGVKATHFIASNHEGSAQHYNLEIRNSAIRNLSETNGCTSIFYAYKSMLADSFVVRNSVFSNNQCRGFIMDEEKDDKGYYNAEKITISQNIFEKQRGILLQVYRGGNDESTLGPQLTFSRNNITDCKAPDNAPLFVFTGVQITNIFANQFTNANPSATLISYKDTVRARHRFAQNSLTGSGELLKNGFVTETNNTINSH